jgi:HD superfamily phosphohydrolase
MLSPLEAYDALLKELDGFVADLMEPYRLPQEPCKEKIVRDAVHGYQILRPHEVEILDSPLVQRLRFIHQTGLAYFVYPSAGHNRLEHSLGVAKVAEQMALALNRITPTHFRGPAEIEELRLAALLHDIGHTFFSHVSEEIIEHKFHDTVEALRSHPDFHPRQEVGEILSYMLLNTPSFRAFLEEVFDRHDLSHDPNRIAGLIVKRSPNPLRDQFKADIISGPFDADKLDYLVRDCHFTGIRSDVDVERVYYTVDTRKRPREPRYLAMRASGISILEQILFNRMLLYTAIYHHQKVRALECMVKAVFEQIADHPEDIQHERNHFNSIVDFLRLSEGAFFCLGEQEPSLRARIETMANRRTLKRCLQISRATIAPSRSTAIVDLKKLATEPARLRDLRELVFDRLPKHRQRSIHDLWVDVPKGPNIDKDAQQCYIVDGFTEPRTLRYVFPIQEWLESYEVNKWKGHVFYVDEEGYRDAAAAAAATQLRLTYKVRLKPEAWTQCKLRPPP